MKILIAFLLTTTSAMAACELNFKNSNICADLTWTQGPVLNQPSSFVLKFDRDYSPYKLKVDIWMQMGSHGHGSRPLIMRSISQTEVEFTQAYFVMAGKWQVRGFLLNDAGTTVDSAVSEIKL